MSTPTHPAGSGPVGEHGEDGLPAHRREHALLARRSWARGGGIALAVCAVLLGLTWTIPAETVLGAAHTDMVGQFIAWRSFAADSLRGGDLPLWNPYTYGGQPFLGGFQSALLYPLNAVFLVLPLERAINFSILAHLVLLGWGVYYWASRRGLGTAAAVACAAMFPLSGVVFPHIYAGHLSNLCTMAWAPWMFAGLEQAWRDRKLSGLLLAGAAICMQVSAGQIQYVFLLGIAAGIHAIVASFVEPAVRARALPVVAIAGFMACGLAAAQLLPGLAAGAEGVRQGKLEYAFAASFSLPPENIITALAPGFFGATYEGAHPYWGRCYPWEMSIYIGVAGIFFAIAGAWRHGGADIPDSIAAAVTPQKARADLVVAGVLLMLALGRHLPIHQWLYDFVPGFGRFRGMSKFTFPAMLFAVLAAGAGIDAVIRHRVPMRRLALAAMLVGAGLAAFGFWLRLAPGVLGPIFDWISARANDDLIAPPILPASAAAHASWSLVRSAIICVILGLCVLLAAGRPMLRWIAIALLPLEMMHFAATHFTMTPVSAAMPAELRKFVAENPGDYRVLNLLRPNNGYLLGAPDLWGNDPGVLKRYAEFMTFTQGGDPDAATQNVNFHVLPPVYSMLRCRYAFVPAGGGVDVREMAEPLPRALLLADYRVLPNRDAMFAALADPAFDPRQTVLLEREPYPRPRMAASTGIVRVLSATGDSLEIEATVDSPSLLLITDLFSRDWRARPLAGSSQSDYEILPANYILRAVPLAAGRHHLAVEYAPPSLRLGLGVSTAVWLAWFACVVALLKQSREESTDVSRASRI